MDKRAIKCVNEQKRKAAKRSEKVKVKGEKNKNQFQSNIVKLRQKLNERLIE